MTPHDSGSAERGGLSGESGFERGDRRGFRRDLLCTCLGRGLDLGRQRGLLLCEQAIPLGLASYVDVGVSASTLVPHQRFGQRTFRRFCSGGLVLLGVLSLSAPVLSRLSARCGVPGHQEGVLTLPWTTLGLREPLPRPLPLPFYPRLLLPCVPVCEIRSGALPYGTTVGGIRTLAAVALEFVRGC